MELWKYYRILRKRKWLIIIGTIVCVGIVAIANVLSGQKWEAYTTVMEKPPGEREVYIFGATYQTYDPKMRLANLAQMVTSRTVLENAYRTLAYGGMKTDPKEILETINVTPIMDTSVLYISVQSSDRDEALNTARCVANEFIKFYNSMNTGGASRTKEFIEKELPKIEARLKQIREETRAFKEQSGAVMLPRQTDVLLQQVAQFQTSASQYAIQEQMSRARLKSIEQKLKEFPETRTAATVVAANPVWQTLQSELAKQEIQLQGMLRERTPKHPDVQALQRQIEETRRQLGETAQTVLNSTTESADPVRDQLLQNYALALAEHASASAAASASAKILASLMPELESLPEKEMRLAQLTLDEEAAKNTYALLRQKLDEATIKANEAENVGAIQIIDEAQVRPADQRKGLKLLLAIILGPIFCSGIAFLLNYLDNTVRTPAEAEELLGLPVFAVVPLAREHSLAEGKALPAMDASYQMLSTNLLIADREVEDHTFLVASAEPNVGRSTTAANLAITLARDGARVILIDADMRQPALHKMFRLSNDRGLSNVLAGQLAIEDALQPTTTKDLLVMTSGPLPTNPVRLLRSPEVANFVQTVNGLADFVIFDSPAGVAFPDSSLLAALVKNVVIVYAAGTVPRGAEAEFGKRLEQVGANVIGVVLTMVRPEDSHGYYYFRSGYQELLKDGKYVGTPSTPAIGSGDAGASGEK